MARITRYGYLKRLVVLLVPLWILWMYLELNFMPFRFDFTPKHPLALGLTLYAAIGLGLLAWWTARRLHDFNEPGWKALILLVPVANLFWFLVILTEPGTIGMNKYGQDPRHRYPLFETKSYERKRHHRHLRNHSHKKKE